MNLSSLLSLLDEQPAYDKLIRTLSSRKSRQEVVVLEAARPYLVAALQRKLNLPLLVITSQPENSRRWHEQIQSWSPARAQLFPEPDGLPYGDASADVVTLSERLKTLSLVSLSSEPFIVIASALAATSKIISRAEFVTARETVSVGKPLEPLQFIDKWQTWGYELEDAVEVPGTMSRRGGIVDIFPPDSQYPIRIELFANRVESLRFFDPTTQKSLKLISSATIIPARELSHRDSLPDHLPDNALVILDDPRAIETAVRRREEQAEDWLKTSPAAEVSPYVPWDEFKLKTESLMSCLALLPWGDNVLQLPFSPPSVYAGKLEPFIRNARRLTQAAGRLVVVTAQARRLEELLEEDNIPVASPGVESGLPQRGTVSLISGAMREGWQLSDTLTVVTDREIFGFTKQRRLASKRPVRHRWLLSQLSPGDYVVHVDHGIARFSGITRMNADGIQRDYLALEYADGDRLYVPVEQMSRVGRYVGLGGSPTLTRLSGGEWAHAKRRVREAVAEIARELLNLYALREIAPGFSFSADTVWQQELEASFPYVETSDQLQAIQAVKEDMEKARPMDRIICGDVGYGKTEVALRAAFKAVMDNKQVAMLVPTTILAQQHYNTFVQRLGTFPLRVAMLSRFCSPEEEQTVLEGLANGTVDICIGTHRLLQKDVVLKDLGLVIIDEEQRFGVMHKEHFKKLRREVDVLTLSATPIPRTLHMALSGIRDLSTMETPPEQRLPVKTCVGSFNEDIVRQAIIRELERNGQVFFVHNRVQDIALVAGKLRRIVPEARIAIAHGQMPEEELEEIVTRFVSGEYDVLVTTTIIESGVDLPQVNTLIVNQADKLGLTQLYQLRGRVGRGDVPAYAYFFHDHGKVVTQQAEKRLETIFSATQLGAGFDIAMKDLEIRGAGSVLGVEQSGQIASVGFELYCQFLAQAVEEIRGGGQAATTAMLSVCIDLPLSFHIPEDYVPDLDTRISIYRRLSQIEELEQIGSVAAELDDRFGKPPQAVSNLLYALRIKLLAAKAGVESINAAGNKIVLKSVNELSGTSVGNYPGVRCGFHAVSLDLRRHRDDWRVVLEEILSNLSRPLCRVL